MLRSPGWHCAALCWSSGILKQFNVSLTFLCINSFHQSNQLQMIFSPSVCVCFTYLTGQLTTGMLALIGCSLSPVLLFYCPSNHQGPKIAALFAQALSHQAQGDPSSPRRNLKPPLHVPLTPPHLSSCHPSSEYFSQPEAPAEPSYRTGARTAT